MRLAPLAALLWAGQALAQASFPVGTTVLASPNQMNSIWTRCVVRQPPSGHKGYELECADEYRASSGLVKTLNVLTVPPKWVKADDPSFRPDFNIPAIRAGIEKQKTAQANAAKNKPAPKADGAAKTVQLGAYECWAFSSARMMLNFTVTAAGRYTASDGSKSTFTHDPATGAMVFKGYLAESLPTGFTAKYYEPRGKPTVSFRSARGSEASFCEKR